jgi:hypothetical protein
MKTDDYSIKHMNINKQPSIESKEKKPIHFMSFPSEEKALQAKRFLETKIQEFERKAVEMEESNGNSGVKASAFVHRGGGGGLDVWVSTTVRWPYTEDDKKNHPLTSPTLEPVPWREGDNPEWDNSWNERLDVFPELIELGGKSAARGN